MNDLERRLTKGEQTAKARGAPTQPSAAALCMAFGFPLADAPSLPADRRAWLYARLAERAQRHAQ